MKEEVRAFQWNPSDLEAAADKATTERIVGSWTAAANTDSDRYHILEIRRDATFTVKNKNGNTVSGDWRIEQGFLLLSIMNAQQFEHWGFHKIDILNEHQLVCGIAMSTAGRMRFTK